jgi:CRP/FNR family transcriptional regulator, cyclic AMP receptor protein
MNPQDLKKINVFSAHDDAALARLGAVLAPREFADGETIFAEESPGDGMHFILSGAVRIAKRTGVAGDVAKTLAVIEAGDYFGEMSLFDQKPRSASAVAAGRTQTFWLSKAAFDDLPKAGGQAGMDVLFGMIRTSSERIRRLNRQVIVYDEIGKAIGESTDLQQLLEVIAQQLCSGTLADWAMILLRAQFSDRVEVRCCSNLSLDAAQREALEGGAGPWATALREPDDRIVRDVSLEEPFKSAVKLGFEPPALLLAPIRIEGGSLGLIVLGGRQAGQFDANDLNLVRGVARQAAQAIVNARHREEDAARARHAKQFVRF